LVKRVMTRSRRVANAPPILLSVQVGAVAPLGPNGVPSGFVKRPDFAA
jgi:hypothetical protein